MIVHSNVPLLLCLWADMRHQPACDVMTAPLSGTPLALLLLYKWTPGLLLPISRPPPGPAGRTLSRKMNFFTLKPIAWAVYPFLIKGDRPALFARQRFQDFHYFGCRLFGFSPLLPLPRPSWESILFFSSPLESFVVTAPAPW